MALQITGRNGKFYLKGKLNNSTSQFFVTYFEHFITKNKKVIIKIDKVNEITKDGLKAINTLISVALKKGKIFSVIGYGAKEIYDHFDKINVA
ncbi:hypothetical protein LNI90_05520 [Tenacibaculum dicentrarchi]|uniref:STAS domain-containing protein n=1 Tax=Tenacibaculum dicentrarchi TaxID=669041 RepID=A0ABP1EJH9_9FLAO|nr:hypothetical protein [Tenacibaculum dicentrarchi]MCD8407723.1 hypothetical protein [Tenacibaculum dicentrarchi]MCD8414961.1 hypothetical protein [Tenacibaculum dicentrarchi]MCD8420085.1 hypothetical protein [Tenacibaculum dicentrarchi]MCD8425120.1 hypothetical protein [Tenacibaculum dicentrarchi]